MKCLQCGRGDSIFILNEMCYCNITYGHFICKACGKEFTASKTGGVLW